MRVADQKRWADKEENGSRFRLSRASNKRDIAIIADTEDVEECAAREQMQIITAPRWRMRSDGKDGQGMGGLPRSPGLADKLDGSTFASFAEAPTTLNTADDD